MGRCPKCASSFTFAPVDDRHLPESRPAQPGDESAAEPVPEKALGAAIAAAAAATEQSPAAADLLAERPPPAPVPRLHPARIGGALALFCSGTALVGSSVSFFHGLILPLSILGLFSGIAAVGVAIWSGRARLLLLPAFGSVQAAAVLIVVWFFPGLLGPAYEYSRRRPEPTPVGLHAVPLPGAPALDQVPDWIDARRYALQEGGLRVQVIDVGILPPAKTDGKTKTPPKERLLVRVRVSQQGAGAKPIERAENPAPTLGDELGKSFPLVQTEFFDLGGGADKPGLYPVPTIEETFVFEAPDKDCKNLRLELPAARWHGTGAFRFVIQPPGPDSPR
jgi:hypothetical protein